MCDTTLHLKTDVTETTNVRNNYLGELNTKNIQESSILFREMKIST